MSKAKPWYHKNAPRWDGHEPPAIKEQNRIPSKTPKKVLLVFYIKRPQSLSRRRWLRQMHTYGWQSYEDPMKMRVDTHKRKFKNRKAALQALEHEKQYYANFGWKLVNYRIVE